MCPLPENPALVAPATTQSVVRLQASNYVQAVAELESLDRGSMKPAMKAAAEYNLGVAAATAGDLTLAQEAFTQALHALSATTARDRDKVRSGSIVGVHNTLRASAPSESPNDKHLGLCVQPQRTVRLQNSYLP